MVVAASFRLAAWRVCPSCGDSAAAVPRGNSEAIARTVKHLPKQLLCSWLMGTNNSRGLGAEFDCVVHCVSGIGHKVVSGIRRDARQCQPSVLLIAEVFGIVSTPEAANVLRIWYVNRPEPHQEFIHHRILTTRWVPVLCTGASASCASPTCQSVPIMPTVNNAMHPSWMAFSSARLFSAALHVRFGA